MLASRTMSSSRYRVHWWIDALLPVVLVALGLFAADPGIWYSSFGGAFLALAGPVLAGAWLVTFISERRPERIQGPRRRPPKIAAEARDTALAMLVAASLIAWPLSQWRLGRPTAMVTDLDAAGISTWTIVLQTLFGLVLLDAWLYWKHRLLHTRALFGFHRGHHAFRDPTAFASFAVGPVESLLTFWPLLILCIPAATHWAPLYFGLVVGFVNLNFYLHCGVRIGLLERTLPRAMINTSAFHNVHHSHADVHFGEAMILWDAICKTRLVDRPSTQPLA